VEKAIRGSRRADIVIANHALVLTQAAFDGARAARGSKADSETTQLKAHRLRRGPPPVRRRRLGLRLALSGAEAAELRRWIRGPEGRGRRGRGSRPRLMEILGDRDDAQAALRRAAAPPRLPGEGWSAASRRRTAR
jgi:ATP-dependent DNA helicase DinG